MKTTSTLHSSQPRTAIEAQHFAYETRLGACARFVPDEKFAEKTGIQPLRYWSLRSGRAVPRPHELKALATFFGCPTDDLIDLPASVAA